MIELAFYLATPGEEPSFLSEEFWPGIPTQGEDITLDGVEGGFMVVQRGWESFTHEDIKRVLIKVYVCRPDKWWYYRAALRQRDGG